MGMPIARRARSAGIGAVALVAMTLAGPLAATADDADAGAADGCTVTAAGLEWGIKESFRAYISGTIANGAWETAGGATYETPVFRWTDAVGTIEAATGLGEVAFVGSVRFTGHGGLLDVTIADPVLRFHGADVEILADIAATDPSGAQVADAQRVPVATARITPSVVRWAPGAVNAWEAIGDVTLLETGAVAFGGFYPAGEALDPLALSVTLADDCAAPAPATAVAGGIVTAVVLAVGGLAAALAPGVGDRRRPGRRRSG